MKEFAAALAEVEDSDLDEGIPFGIAGYDNGLEGERAYLVDSMSLVAYKPSDGQLAVLMADISRHTSTQTKVGGLINFFDAILDEAGSAYVTNRLLERKDPFGLPQVQEIVEWLTEEWSGRPTRRSSGSTPSQRAAGQRSTRRTPART